MKFRIAAVLLISQLIWAQAAHSQVTFTGKVWAPKSPELAAEMPPNTGIPQDYFSGEGMGQPPYAMPFPNVRCFATPSGSGNQTIAARTWELAPRGWYNMSGNAGHYTMLFTGPAQYGSATVNLRPVVITNVFANHGEVIDRKIVPNFDYGVFHDGHYDEKAASEYYQTFTAKGTSITQITFRPVHDGVDGIGPGSQNVLVSVHEKGPGTPDTWKQVGPTMVVLNMDAGAPKDYDWAVGLNSGELPVTPGKTYAIRLKPEAKDGKFQMFWRPNEGSDTDCYRLGTAGETGWIGRNLFMSVGSDCDGLLIPYNKRAGKDFDEFAGGAKKWTQTYVAQGRSLAGVVLYAATSGIQPSINHQRVAVRVRNGGPNGRLVGIEKIAVGNGIHTGDAAWGTFGVAFAPGEVPLVPGRTYAIEFESIENFASLDGYVDIKGRLSDNKPGFNPYRKSAPDTYERGTSYLNGTDEMDFDLDMQVIEYQHAVRDWDKAVDAANLLKNGDMESGKMVEGKPDESRADAWKLFTIDSETTYHYLTDGPEHQNRMLRVIGGSFNGKKVDGGYVQRVDGLNRLDTYRISGKVRSSYVADMSRAAYVGYDPTGQTEDPKADTIVWTTMPNVHSLFVPYASDPIRPDTDAISVWLRGFTSTTDFMPFKVDFDDFAMQRVKTGVPGAS